MKNKKGRPKKTLKIDVFLDDGSIFVDGNRVLSESQERDIRRMLIEKGLMRED